MWKEKRIMPTEYDYERECNEIDDFLGYDKEGNFDLCLKDKEIYDKKLKEKK